MTWLAETAMLAHGWRRFALLLVAGAMAGLSIAPLFILPALFVAMPVWIWCLDGAERRKGWRRLIGPAFTIGFAFGLGYFTVSFHWLGNAFFVDGGLMLVLMPFAIVALAAMIALFWGLASAMAHIFWTQGAWRVVTLATFLTMAEWARGHVLTGFPFDLLGYALTPTEEMMQSASLIGIYGLSFVAALIGLTPALIWPADQRTLTRRLVPFFFSLAVIAAQLGYGHVRLAGTIVTPRTDVKLRLVQPLVYEHADWSQVDPAAVIDKLLALTEMQTSPANTGLSGITQVVWPESSLPFFLPQYPEALARIARMLPDKVVLLAGAPRQDFTPGGAASTTPPYNSLLAINSDGEVFDSYDKSHLVPFGEFLPFQDVFAKLGIRQFVPGAEGWRPGDARRRLLMLPGSPPFLALICYEVLFSGDLGDTAQAQYILNITNDAWFDASIGPAQHAQHARVRAVEEGMSLVRAANSGVTMLVDPLGRVTAQLPVRQMNVLDVVPDQRLPDTLFSRLRYWPLLGALLAALTGTMIAWQHGRRRS